MLYTVKEGHLDTARDIVLVMLVNKCASYYTLCSQAFARDRHTLLSMHDQAPFRKEGCKGLACKKGIAYDDTRPHDWADVITFVAVAVDQALTVRQWSPC